MTSKASVLVLCGGLSAERDVSLRSGRRVAAALSDAGHAVQVADFDANVVALIEGQEPDVVVPLLHGAEGEDGSLATVLELLDRRFVGSPSHSCRLAFDKPNANEIVAALGFSVPLAIALPQRTFRELGARTVVDSVLAQLSVPLVVKPTHGGSALGVGVAHTPEEVSPALVAAFAYGDSVLMQRFVSGVEIAVSVVEGPDGPRALPPVEIRPDGPAYDYRSRYTAGLTEFFAPARIDEAVRAAAERLALAAHDALGLRDWSRTDIIVDPDGTPWYLETNSVPGMTETSLFPQAVAAAGESFPHLCSLLVEQAAVR